MTRLDDAGHLVLVGLCWHRPGDPRTPLGQASLAAALRASTPIEITSLVFPAEGRPDPRQIATEILQDVRDDRTDVALGIYVWNDDAVRTVLVELRRRGYVGRIILGGPQISYAGPGLETLYPEADLFIRGYAEQALCDLYTGTQPAVIPGVHLAGEPDLGTVAEVVLEDLPSPYEGGGLALGFSPNAPRRFVRWETQRGCPYRCSFCQHREAGARLKKTRFSTGRIEAEIARFVAAGVEEIAVLDPVFNTPGSHANEVLAALRQARYAGHLSLQCRVEGLTPAFLEALAGLDVTIELGLQTTNPAEGTAVRRSNKLKRVDHGLRALRDRDLDHEVSLIYGLPLQTLASFRASVDWCLRRQVPRIKAFPLMLLRGTPLERDRARWGLVENDDAIPQVVATSTFGRADHRQMARLSAALRATEDAHPPTVEGLGAVVIDALPAWSPQRVTS